MGTLLAAVLLLQAACGENGPTGPQPGDLEIVARGGDGQLGPPGTALRYPLEVEVREIDNGKPAAGIRVEWTVIEGTGATVTPTATVTDSMGLAAVSLRLGDELGTYRVAATFEGMKGPAPEFSARAVAAPSIEDITVGPVRAGDPVIIRGRNFSPERDQNVVLFSGVRGPVTLASETELQVRIPACLPTRDVAVTAALGSAVSAAATLSVVAGPGTYDFSVGQDRRFASADGTTCVRIPPGQGDTYLAVVSSVSTVGGQRYPFSLSGLTATGAEATAGASQAVPAPAAASAEFPGRQPSGQDLQDEWDRRVRALEEGLLPARTREASGRPAAAAGRVPQIGERRDFDVLNKDGAFDRVTALVRHVGLRAVIYEDVDAPSGGLTSTDYAAFAAEFDDPGYSTVIRAFGGESDLDDNERVAILFTPVVNRLTPRGSTGGFIGGFFFGLDLLTGRDNSNEGEIFYTLVADPTGQFSDPRDRDTILRAVPAILAHEFQHMVHFNQRVLLRGAATTEALWLSEAMAQMAEDLVAEEFRSRGESTVADRYALGNYVRAQRYLSQPSDASLVVTVGKGSLEERGAGWLFLKYLTEQLGGEALLRQLTQTSLTGVTNVTSTTGRSWLSLIPDWLAALYLDDGPTPVAARLEYPVFDLRATLSRLDRGFTLVPQRPGAMDFVAAGTLRSSTAAFFLLDIPQSGDGLAVRAAGQDGGPEPFGAQFQLMLVRLD